MVCPPLRSVPVPARWMAGWSRLVATLGLGMATLACEPAPKYPAIEQPVVGRILAEMSVVATGAAQRIDMAGDPQTNQAQLRIEVPAGAYPVGTKVTVRLVDDLPIAINACEIMSHLLRFWTKSDLSLQILPAKLAPAVPLRIEFAEAATRWNYAVLHARESDSAWTFAAPSTPDLPGFAIPTPGLWTVVKLVLPTGLAGWFQRSELTCDNGVVTNPPDRYLHLAETSYVWGRPIPDSACWKVASGTLGMACSYASLPSLEFLDQQLSTTHFNSYSLDATGTGIWLGLSVADGCPGYGGGRVDGSGREHYVPLPPGTSPPPMPETIDGRCPVDAGGSPDAGRD